MSDNKRVHRVSPAADQRIRDYAERKGITVFEAASLWREPEEPIEQGAESTPAPPLDTLADPRVIKFATAKGITPAAALEKMLNRGAARAVNLAAFAAKKKGKAS